MESRFDGKTERLMRLSSLFSQLKLVKDAADGKSELVSNQGQAMDGYSELANYRQIIEDFDR